MLSNHNCQSGSDSFGFDQFPIDSNNPIVLKSLQRFRKNEISRPFLFFEASHPELGPGIGPLDRHDAIVFDFGLEMSILRRLLPKRVDFGFAGGFNDVRKALRLRFQ